MTTLSDYRPPVLRVLDPNRSHLEETRIVKTAESVIFLTKQAPRLEVASSLEILKAISGGKPAFRKARGGKSH
jgi:hypothetical protein